LASAKTSRNVLPTAGGGKRALAQASLGRKRGEGGSASSCLK